MLKVGVIGFGGGSALIPVLEQEMVTRRARLSAETFRRHTVVASITPGALPVKMGALAGAERSSPWLAATLALAVALPGTTATLALTSLVTDGPATVVWLVQLASVGITVFIIALLAHYVVSVVRGTSMRPAGAAAIVLVTFLATGGARAIEVVGVLTGTGWSLSDLPQVGVLHAIGLGLLVVAIRSLARRGERSASLPRGVGRGRLPVTRTLVALVLPAAAAATVATAILGAAAGSLLARVALSSVTSFGGGEAYVAVAEGYFVASGDVSAADYYQQLVPIANALPGPILVKLAAAIGYASAAPEHGAAGGWLLGGSAGLVAIAACTLIAVLALAAYERVSGAPIVQDLGAVLLPVISGLLVTTSTEMLSAVGDVADQADASASAVMWVALLAVGAVAALRHRWRHDLPILVICGAAGVLALGL